MQVVVEWAANWCSLCLEADLEFAQFAADLKAEQHQDIQLVRVNLDKAEVSFGLCKHNKAACRNTTVKVGEISYSENALNCTAG